MFFFFFFPVIFIILPPWFVTSSSTLSLCALPSLFTLCSPSYESIVSLPRGWLRPGRKQAKQSEGSGRTSERENESSRQQVPSSQFQLQFPTPKLPPFPDSPALRQRIDESTVSNRTASTQYPLPLSTYGPYPCSPARRALTTYIHTYTTLSTPLHYLPTRYNTCRILRSST